MVVVASAGMRCMRPRVSSILGFPEEKLKSVVENDDEDDDGSISDAVLEFHMARGYNCFVGLLNLSFA